MQLGYRGRAARLGDTRRPAAATELGAASGFGTKTDVLSSLPRCKRLTVPAAVTEDTEKTTVFHYSKVKERGPRRICHQAAALAKML
jgi:hypothetical protein